MNRFPPRSLSLTILALSVCVATAAAASGEPLSYERDVRPLLKTHCFHCHGEGDARQGGLDLRLRRLVVQGGDSGPAVAPGDPSQSLLLQRLRSGEMPPEEVRLRPTSEEIDTIERWIAGGAVARQDEPPDLDPGNYLTAEERAHWSFQPVTRPTPPAVAHLEHVHNPIDQFILAKLEARQLTFAPAATRTALVRRLSFDLLGLPPSPEVVVEFLTDESPLAYERLVDRLLSAPQYGERWGRHWLDVVGYADSEGYTEDDPPRPEAYKYRDYVVRAFNGDLPFDRFIVEQLAGDELLSPPLTNLTPEAAEKLAATGFLRMAPDGTASGAVDQNLARNEVLAKTIEIVSTSLLGLTVACAQCHDHRYDPISQADYYAWRAIFEPALNWKEWLKPDQRRISLYTDADRAAAAAVEAEAQQVLAERTEQQEEFIQATLERELAKLPETLREPIRVARNTPEKERSAEQQKLLRDHPSVNVSAGSLYLYDRQAAEKLKKLQEQADAIRLKKPKEEFVRAVWEPAGQPLPKTFVFHRGDHDQPRQEVHPHELNVLSTPTATLPEDDQQLASSGRRLAYARWLTSGQHPLVARVIVNRIWLNHFGQGLVPTPGDFGRLGVPPTHPELLDWLASEFVDSGWSVKHLHRLIVTSATYQQAATSTTETEASLYAHYPLRRLDAESLRDAMLAASGALQLSMEGPPVPVMADAVGQFVIGQENLDAGRPGAVIDLGSSLFRRSLYVQVRRSRPLSVLAPFDLPRMEPNCVVRHSSTVSPQSLLLMNSEFVIEQATRFARRVQGEAGENPAEQVKLAWRLAFAAEPTPAELAEAGEFVEEQTRVFEAMPPADKADSPQPTPREEAFASFCHALLSSNRFLYID